MLKIRIINEKERYNNKGEKIILLEIKEVI